MCIIFCLLVRYSVSFLLMYSFCSATNAYDVVLVDTAGRMQDNEPLMRALSKLVNLNNPDLVLFVGEALVGNDSIDQVTKFNQVRAILV